MNINMNMNIFQNMNFKNITNKDVMKYDSIFLQAFQDRLGVLGVWLCDDDQRDKARNKYITFTREKIVEFLKRIDNVKGYEEYINLIKDIQNIKYKWMQFYVFFTEEDSKYFEKTFISLFSWFLQYWMLNF
jgi:hypothetical protein